MLLLRVSSEHSGRSLLTVSDADKNPDPPLETFWAEGAIRSQEHRSRTLDHYRFILTPDFDENDVQMFGRYGILELGASPLGEHPSERLYICGGKKADANPALLGMLRLSPRDHRAFVNLVRRHDSVRCELAFNDDIPASSAEPVLLRSHEASALNRLLRYGAAVSLAARPFLIPNVAVAQCDSLSSGAYDSGTNYSGVDDNHIINSDEGGSATTGYIPDSTSGVTIAGGLDLVVHTSADLAAMGVPQNFIQQFTPFLATAPGQYTVGAAAQKALNANPTAATINTTQANQINSAIYNYYSTNVASAFNNATAQNGNNTQFSDLNVQWQTVIVSMYFQAQSITGTQFWQQVTTGQWSAAIQNLANFGGPSSAQNNRAAKEANYLNSTGCTNGTDNGG